nr:MAG TPA: adenine-specific methyltransferase [Caudoviricetes sp.]
MKKEENAKRDWTGNSQAAFVTFGAEGHATHERAEYDYYATEPRAVELLLEQEEFESTIWEPACGEGHISKVLTDHGYKVISTDLIDRGYGEGVIDFLTCDAPIVHFPYDIITNPPYKYATEFAEKALELVAKYQKVAMFLKLTFMESKKRKSFFQKYPPRKVYVSSGRLMCGFNGQFKENSGRAIAYAWYVWEKGFKGDPVIRWIN